jgi:hypothetical protein
VSSQPSPGKTCGCCGETVPELKGNVCPDCAKGRHYPDKCKNAQASKASEPPPTPPTSEPATQPAPAPVSDPPAAADGQKAAKGTDFRTLYNKEFLGAWDLPEDGRDVTVTIERVEGREIIGEGGLTDRKPVLFFVGKKKGMVCNITNGRAIAKMYGRSIEGWVGKPIKIYAGQVRKGRDLVDSILVRGGERPAAPRARA